MRVVVALLLAAAPAAAQPALTLAPGETLLSIEAEGASRARPDVMTLNVGVVTTGATTAQALRANNELASRLVEALRASNVAPNDARTSNLDVEPRISPGEEQRAETEGRPPKIVGYTASNTLEVRFRDLARAPEIMERLVDAGANEVRGPTFSFSDPLPQRRAAERAAVQEARLEANNYAGAMGKRVARVMRVSERRSYTDDGGDQIVITGSRTSRTPIEPGELTTRATIFVDFAVVDR